MRLRKTWPRGVRRADVLAAAAAALALAAHGDAFAGQTVRVGPQHELKSPSAAAKVARDGDTIEIEAGLYPRDAAVWRQRSG